MYWLEKIKLYFVTELHEQVVTTYSWNIIYQSIYSCRVDDLLMFKFQLTSSARTYQGILRLKKPDP